MLDHNKLTADLKAVQADVRLRAFIAEQMEARFVEATIVEKVWASLLEGDRIVSVLDEDENKQIPVNSLDDLNMQVFNLDEVHVRTRSGAWIFLVMGNGWDMVSDYSARLEDEQPKFAALQEWISKQN